jgi:16S rRNA (guanine527-N7)-methyltransferase
MTAMNTLIDQALTRAELTPQLSEPLSQPQRQRLEGFLDLRATWSKTHNLSGPRALTLLSTDLADAIAVWLCADSLTPLIDIGSGSGVPGLMLACLDPNHTIHIVEPIAKRCAFMKTAAHKLELHAVTVHRGRWPEDRFDDLGGGIAISRAVVSPEEWPPLAHRPHLTGIMQMLAHHRPTWPLPEYTLAQEVNYRDPEGGERLVRRWMTSTTQ